MPKARVLIVEDEWFIADDHERVLEAAGYEVVGPASTVDAALQLVDAGGVDAGLLDVALRNEVSYPVARRLAEIGVPFAFVTGYAARDLPEPFAGVTILGKPVAQATLLATLDELIGSGTSGRH